MNIDYELDIIRFWDEKEILSKVNDKNRSGKLFTFIEGPPYPTGDAHLGHLRNWAVKDSVLRFKRYCGYNVHARDGYDVHGLPVEQKVQKKLKIKDTKELKEKYGVNNFISECRKFVDLVINDMKGVRKRYALWMDTNHWQTSHPEYISNSWRFFKKAQEKGLLYKDFKCVAWSPGLETTLSDYEVKDSYAELEDPSIYIRIKLKKEHTTTNYDEFFLIWTTTPWTLEANQAIAVNKHFNYAKVLIEDEKEKYVLIVGEPLVEQVVAKISKTQKIKAHKILEIVNGTNLVGLNYEPIYQNNQTQKEFAKNKMFFRVLHADFVSLGEGETHLEKLSKKTYKHEIQQETVEVESELNVKKQKKVIKEGTGVVHEAPAHGMEDFELCREEGIDDVYCVVDEKGLLISESLWAGKNFRDANKEIIDYLQKRKQIIHSEWKKHTYPLCWRSKVPIVYRTTQQWYIRRSKYIPEIIKENKNVKWTPSSAQTSFNNLISDAGDWAISRQRFWGIPIPIFEDEQGNYEVFGSKEELEERVGKKLEDLHLDNLAEVSYKKEGKVMKHVGYTCDVWFDSGCASFASHYGEGLNLDEILKKYYPIDWVTEGEDQIRGWFSSLFNVGYVVGDKAPYNQVLFYRFIMDKNGVKMSKSLGNGIDGAGAIQRWGTDRTRYYLLTKKVPEEQINFDPDEFNIVNGFFNTLENVFLFCNSYLKEYEVKHSMIVTSNLDIVDLWILYKLNRLVESFSRKIEKFRMNLAFKEIEEFIVGDFSKVYLKLIKERVEQRDENLILVFNEVLKKTLIMLSCGVPLKCEELYKKTKIIMKKESIFLENIPEPDLMLIKKAEELDLDKNFYLAQEIVQSILNAREKIKVGVRWPLSQADIIMTKNVKEELKPFEPIIKALTNVKTLNYDLNDVKVNYTIKPNFVSLKENFKNPKDAIRAINLNKKYIADDIVSGVKSGKYDGVELNLEKHILKELTLEDKELISSEFNYGFIILHSHQDEILLEQGYLRELIRRVQDMRKVAKLDKNKKIILSFNGSDDYYIGLIKLSNQSISNKVGAVEITNKDLENKQEFVIKDKKLTVSFNVI